MGSSKKKKKIEIKKNIYILTCSEIMVSCSLSTKPGYSSIQSCVSTFVIISGEIAIV